MAHTARQLSVDSALTQFREDILAGLSADPKRLPCKHFYNERGSQLFEQICELDEYYLTRTELSIMRRYASEMGAQIGEGVMLVEYGSGSSIKTRLLLDALPDPVAYVPVDISGDHLDVIAAQLAEDYPHIEILPVCADFTQPFALPKSQQVPTHAAVYFPGSTIGNFTPDKAIALLSRIAPLCGRQGGLLIGIDLQKDVDVIERAYNDAEGVTAEFNLNLLDRINCELDATIDISGFEHQASYNPDDGRVEIYIRSVRDQAIQVEGKRFDTAAGELIHTEYSHKYTVEGFEQLAAEAGLELHKTWTDERRYFAVLHFVVMD